LCKVLWGVRILFKQTTIPLFHCTKDRKTSERMFCYFRRLTRALNSIHVLCFPWTLYAQKQQLVQQSLLNGSYFSNISCVFSRDFNVGMPFKLRFSVYIFSICYLMLKFQSEFTATAGHCQELRSQILKVSPPIPSSPVPRQTASQEPAAFPFSHG